MESAWPGAPLLRRGPEKTRAFAGRFHRDLPSERVVSFTAQTLWEQLREPRATTTEARYEQYARTGASFARRVTRHLEPQPLHPRLGDAEVGAVADAVGAFLKGRVPA